MAPTPKTLDERFWPKVPIRSVTECWEWEGGRSSRGYGVIMLEDQRNGLAHRVAYEMRNGAIPDGLVVRHKCDNPPCVNPHHLELGTHSDNAWDKVSRGRKGNCGRNRLEKCQRGHDDWYVQASDGRRRCRICRNMKARERTKMQDIPDEPFGSEDK